MISIDSSSPMAPFEQIVDQISTDARTGVLKANEKLPTVRQLADDLNLAPNTVAKAYRKLESLGIIEAHGRNGTFVSAKALQMLDENGKLRLLSEAADHFALVARQVGADESAAQRLLSAAFTRD